MSRYWDWTSFVRRVNARSLASVERAELHTSQKQLLIETLEKFHEYADPSDPAQPLGLLYLVFRAWGRAPDEQAVHVGSFCQLYLCSADLLDDVQDDDLSEKSHAEVGPAIAMNNAVTLLCLGLNELGAAMELEVEPLVRARYLKTFNRISLTALGAQHLDLMAERVVETAAQVLEMHRGKTSSVALFLECGALLARCTPEQIELYGSIGQELACLIQIVDDLRDIYGKEQSPDLQQRKVTYPLACFAELANPAQKRRLARLLESSPIQLGEVRALLHEAEAVDRCAEQLESLRLSIHERLASLGHASAHHRILLDIVDAVTQSIYESERPPCTAFIRQPEGGFHRIVGDTVSRFLKDVSPWGRFERPSLAPWHLPFYLFDPERNVIHYPDIDGLADEVLPFHAELLELPPAEVSRIMKGQAGFLLAHEMFHALREDAGLTTHDSWHEEYVANRMAVAYCRAFAPSSLEEIERLCELALRGDRGMLGEQARVILERASSVSPVELGYEVDLETSARIHFAMVREFLREEPALEVEMDRYLGRSLPLRPLAAARAARAHAVISTALDVSPELSSARG